MQIRPADRSDLDVVTTLRIEFLSELRGVDPATVAPGFAEATRQFFERGRADGTVGSWLADGPGPAVGLVSVIVQPAAPVPEDPRPLEGLVINMFVRPGFRGRGLGRRLLGAGLDWAHERGLRRLNLYATAAGRPLYLGAGFSPRADWMVLPLPPLPDPGP